MMVDALPLANQVAEWVARLRKDWVRQHGAWAERMLVHKWAELNVIQNFHERLSRNELVSLMDESAWCWNNKASDEKKLFRTMINPSQLECARLAGSIEGYAQIGDFISEEIEGRRDKEE